MFGLPHHPPPHPYVALRVAREHATLLALAGRLCPPVGLSPPAPTGWVPKWSVTHGRWYHLRNIIIRAGILNWLRFHLRF
jgi:hypothetical protein